MANFGVSIPDEVCNRLDGYRERITNEHNLYRNPSRSAVITKAIIEFLNRYDKPEKQGDD